ncbi:MAG: ATP-binding protein [Patescibacteria group bacterium]
MNENESRRELILNKLNQGSLTLSIIAGLILLIDKLKYRETYQGLPPSVILGLILIFVLVANLNHHRHSNLAGTIFIATYFLINTSFLIQWGVNLPIGIIFYALIILMTGVLFGNIWGLISLIGTSLTIILIAILEVTNILHPDIHWHSERISPLDKIPEIIILGIIMTVGYLYNREVNKSLKKSKELETELKAERDLLEIKVEERTKELKEIQLEKMSDLYRFAEFGRLSSGIFHDLMNPLSALTLNLGQVQKNNPEKSSFLEGAIRASHKMEDFISALKNQIRRQSNKRYFSLNEEIDQIIKILNHKIIKNNLSLKFSPTTEIKSYGDQVKFSQVAVNLISNAIDAYAEKKYPHRIINVSLKQQNNYIYLDVSDRAGGIDPINLPRIFEPFFTTKHGVREGLGIGLSSTKNIIEKDFSGSIKIKNDFGYGVKFIVKLPYRHDRSKQRTGRSDNQRTKA